MKKKRIIICSDGAWKSANSKEVTNIIKMKKAIIQGAAGDNVEQIICYDAGVGAKQSFLQRLLSGITGVGLEKNIWDCYRHIVKHYEKGDELYLFGFSRGAYTVRSLAGLLGSLGLLAKKDLKELKNVWLAYRRKEPYAGRKLFKPEITCLGVWDTVGALGVPLWMPFWLHVILHIFLDRGKGDIKSVRSRILSLTDMIFDIVKKRRWGVGTIDPTFVLEQYKWYRYGFHDVRLGENIRYAFHALAIDERRGDFQPTLWKEVTRDSQGRVNHGILKSVKQVWFRGVHSDVGGGYSQTGLSDLPLKWMIENVNKCTGLKFNADHIQKNISPDPKAKPHDSHRFYFGKKVWRKMNALVTIRGEPNAVPKPAHAGEMLHHSVLKREDAMPKNLRRVKDIIKKDK